MKLDLESWKRRLREFDYRHFWQIQLEVRPHVQGIPYWVAAFAVGVLAVVYSGIYTAAIDACRRIFAWNPQALYLTSPLCFILAVWLVERFAPSAGGTGVPQVIQALHFDPIKQRKEIRSFLSLRVACVVGASSILCMLGGGSLGREGPMVHMAACIFYVVGQSFRRIWPANDHRSWIVAGGAAGVAAAFNAPLAGVVFVLEELAQQHFHQFKTVVITAAIIGGMVSQWISGKYLYFGFPKIGTVEFSSLPWAVLVGLFCGAFAYPFHKLLQIDWRGHFRIYLNTRLKFALFIGLCMAALANLVTPETMGGGVSVIEELLFKDERASWSLILGRLVGTIVSHLSGCAGGFLAPALSLGAAMGSKVATLTHYPNHNLLVLVGMAAFLSAIVRAPFTAWVIVMEMTDRHQAIFPLMLASVISHGTTEFLMQKKTPSEVPPPSSPPPVL